MKLLLFLEGHLSRPVARLIVALWFALLIIVLVFFSFQPQAEFRYGNI